mmetsp:Transcript_78111/g.137873  ORF Transcript_78111/g.137873 Transcript_78111/m.137873 type:complete len:204 (+) Transcript_78111:1113-1724(+)
MPDGLCRTEPADAVVADALRSRLFSSGDRASPAAVLTVRFLKRWRPPSGEPGGPEALWALCFGEWSSTVRLSQSRPIGRLTCWMLSRRALTLRLPRPPAESADLQPCSSSSLVPSSSSSSLSAGWRSGAGFGLCCGWAREESPTCSGFRAVAAVLVAQALALATVPTRLPTVVRALGVVLPPGLSGALCLAVGELAAGELPAL